MQHTPLPSSLDPPSISTMIATTPLLLPADHNQSNIDHITSLERSLCSNFMCCGAQLADLHALLEHFEKDHIMVLAPNGKRVYPPDGLKTMPLHTNPAQSSSNSPSSSRSSSESPSSTPSTPATTFSTPSSYCSNRKSSMTVEPVYTPFTPSLPVDPAYPYPDADEIVMAHAPLYEFPADLHAPKASFSDMSSSSDDDEEMSDASAMDTAQSSPIPTYVYGTDKKKPIAAISKAVKVAPTKARRRATPISNSSSDVAESDSTSSSRHLSLKFLSKKTRHGATSVSHGKRREKTFVCPTPRCIKSYLNPNGLKYHLEKGTCQLADSDMDTSEDWPSASPSAENNSNSPDNQFAPPFNESVSDPSSISSLCPTEQNSQCATPVPRPIPTPTPTPTTINLASATPCLRLPPSSSGSALPIATQAQERSPSLNSRDRNLNFNSGLGVAQQPSSSVREEQGRELDASTASSPPQQQHKQYFHQHGHYAYSYDVQAQGQQGSPVYHYPVPSYPRPVEPNTLLGPSLSVNASGGASATSSGTGTANGGNPYASLSQPLTLSLPLHPLPLHHRAYYANTNANAGAGSGMGEGEKPVVQQHQHSALYSPRERAQ